MAEIQILLDTICNTPGSILVRSSVGWVCAGPGADGTILTAHVAPAAPTFDAPQTIGYTWNAITGSFGIGDEAPTAPFSVSKNTSPPQPVDPWILAHFTQVDDQRAEIMLDAFGTGWFTAFGGRVANGTAASPSNVTANQRLTILEGIGYGSTGYPSNGPAMQIMAGEDWTDTSQGAYIIFRTTAIGGALPLERVRIAPSGFFGVGVTAPACRLDVSGQMRTNPVLVASLPAPTAALAGSRTCVTNALGPVFGVNVVGGGAVFVPVYCTGANWRVG